MLYLDLDNFKRVNDTLGHAVGDELLCLVATRLRASLRYATTASSGRQLRARPTSRDSAGDEFIVILPSLRSSADAGVVAGRLIAELREPMQLAQHTLVITPSIGIALYPPDGADVDTLLRNADLAMYFAKRKSPGTCAFFDVSMNERRCIDSRSRTVCAVRWSATNSTCSTSRNSTCAPAPSPGWRRCCAGPTPTWER